MPRARPEGSSRCPYNPSPEAAPQTRARGPAAAAAGPLKSARGEEGWTAGAGTGSGPASSTSGPASPSPSPTARLLRRRHRDACPGCATRATRSFPANSVSSLALTATRDARRVLPRAACSCAQVSEPLKPHYPAPAPRPPAGPTASWASPTPTRPHPPHLHPGTDPISPPGSTRAPGGPRASGSERDRGPAGAGAGGRVGATYPGGGPENTRAQRRWSPHGPGPSRRARAPGCAARARPRIPG